MLSFPSATRFPAQLEIAAKRPPTGVSSFAEIPTQALRPLALATYSARSATLITCSQLRASSCSRKNG